ncbi:MAG: TrbC/VirB2 family protein [Erythrobacter sp.]
MGNTSASLLDPPYDPSVQSSLDWISGMLMGEIAIAVSVVGVAIVGFIMLTGRLPLRRGVQVIIGCFVLLGAPALAASFTEFWQGSVVDAQPLTYSTEAEAIAPREDLPPAQYDPYAGASLRND